MVIYLKHQKHGTKVAMSEMEALLDEKHGWERFDINNFKIKPEPKAEVNADETEKPKTDKTESVRESVTEEYVKKFGRKPHWKMTVEQIQEELCQQH